MGSKLTAAVLTFGLCALVAPARADLYRWTDARGQVHVTDDKSEIPSGSAVTVQPTRGRVSDGSGAASTAPPVTRAGSPPAAPRPVLSVETVRTQAPPRTHLLRFARAGQDISLAVTLNDRVVCDFKADTGASLNTMPRWAASELGLEIDRDTPTILMVGVSGQPQRVPVVTLQSVRVGDVTVENVEVAVVDTMRSGLLGMPFFNHFKVQIDPTQGEMRLTDVDLEKVEGVYDGLGEDAWRQRFGQLHLRLRDIQKARESVPEESETMATRYLEDLDREEQRVNRQLEQLEDRAQAAGVPPSWR
jgi:clan AA aspartic protease (TIGR02281 family)